MKIIEVKDIIRKDVPIYYRRVFSGTVVIEVLNKTEERLIDFTIETQPTGQSDIFITMAEPVDYPLVPLMAELKKFIGNLDSKGELPG